MRCTIKVVGMVAGGRQHVVAHASYGDPVLLVPEPDNPHDPNAIAVYTAPRGALQHPEALVSSVTDPQGGGTVHDDDRVLLMDRQAGYVPAKVAVRFDLAGPVVGYVAEVRYRPPEEWLDGYGEPMRDPGGKVAGFDVEAWLPQRDPQEA